MPADSREDGSAVLISDSAIMRYLGALSLTALATVIAAGVDSEVAIPNLSLVFVVPVIVSGVSLGLGPSLFSAVLGALSFDFFLAAPRYSLMVDDPANIWAICLLFAVGLIASTVAFTSRRRAEEVASLERQLTVLRGYCHDMSSADGIGAAALVTSRTLAALFDLPSVAIFVANEQIVGIQSSGRFEPNAAEISVAKLSLSSGDIVRADVYPDIGCRFDFWPINTRKGASAVLGIAFNSDDRPFAADPSIAILSRVLALSLDCGFPGTSASPGG